MNRLALIVSFVAVLIAGSVAAVRVWPAASAQEERSIPVQVTHDMGSRRDGDTCNVDIEEYFTYFAYQQLVVTDEEGTIVAMHTLRGGDVEEALAPNYACVFAFTIDVPEADFYTLWLGEVRIVGFAADEFPLDEDEAIAIFLE